MAKETKAKLKPKAMFKALMRRSEAGIGIVEEGDVVDLSGLPPKAVAALVADGRYMPVGEMPDDIIKALEEHRGG